MSGDALQDRIANFFLTDEVLPLIDFSLGPQHRIKIDGPHFRAVGEAVNSGKISVGSENFRGRHAAAFYDSLKNRLVVDTTKANNLAGTPSKRDWISIRLELAHEGTHAAIDIAARSVLSVRNDAAAYVAASIYMSLRHGDGKYGSDPIWDAARSIVNQHNMLQTRGVQLGAADIAPLARAIRAHPLYRGSPRFARDRLDGI